jgi:hypothetical protein
MHDQTNMHNSISRRICGLDYPILHGCILILSACLNRAIPIAQWLER